MRHQIGYPWAILLEGHAWWHLGTGYGAYLLIVASEMLMLAIKEKEGNFELQGPTVLPYLKRTRTYKAPTRSTTSNGVVKSRKTE
jgi:dihydroceramidase